MNQRRHVFVGIFFKDTIMGLLGHPRTQIQEVISLVEKQVVWKPQMRTKMHTESLESACITEDSHSPNSSHPSPAKLQKRQEASLS